MKFYPAFLDLRDRPCLVIGGGPVAERKTLALLEAGAAVTLVSPELTSALRELAGSSKISHRAKLFEERDLSNIFLAVAATNSPEVNSHAAKICKGKNILVNVAVPPEESTFIVPSAIERGDLVIAVSTSGASPALSRKIRKRLEREYGPEYEVFLSKLGALRKQLLREVPDEEHRRTIYRNIVDSDVLELLKQGMDSEADGRMRDIAGLHR